MRSSDSGCDGAGDACVLNVLWLMLAGLLAIAHVVTCIALWLTIIGIPLGRADFKLASIALAPLGKEIVPTDNPRAIGATL